jgi:2-polyprenyl-3-methyl-5-hydroxy-6-metoxy-1,4-benzoquinol methylase
MELERVKNWLRGRRISRSRGLDDWNRQYSAGQWNFLASIEEMSRYWVAAGYCSSIPNPSVLDVGCGPGLMEEKLRLLPYSVFLGIDYSDEALKVARRRVPASARLECADLTTFETSEKFDIVTFMEVEWPPMSVAVMQRYERMLRPGGRMLLSLFDGRNRNATLGTWEEVRRNFAIVDMTRVEHLSTGKRWTMAWVAGKR